MKLKAKITSLSEVPEAYHDLYTQVGDEWVLDLDDTDYKAKLSEFRDNNIDLRKKAERATETETKLAALTTQLKQFEGVDPEKARVALEQLQALEDKKLIDSGKIDELLAQRTDRMRQEHDAQLKAALTARDDAAKEAKQFRGKLSEVVIDNSLQQSIGSVATVRKGAMQDVISRGRGVWQLSDEGKPIPKKADGSVMYGKDGEHPISMEEWGQVLLAEAPYLFEGNAGGAAAGNNDGGDSGGGKVLSNDLRAIGDNLEAIADGSVEVVDQ